MHWRIQVVSISDDGTEQLHEIAAVSRGDATLESLGLTLAESQQVLHHLQQSLVDPQVAAYLDPQRACPDCGKQRQLKPSEGALLRPLGALVRERSSPELLHLETQWASLVS